MTTKISSFDVSDYLDSEEMIAEYLTSVLEENDAQLLIAAIGDIAKAKGMKQIADSAGLGRESLYKALTPSSKPRFETILKVLTSLGLQMKIEVPGHKVKAA